MIIADILGIGEFFWKIIIGIVGFLFQLVNYTYQIFLCLAESNIFNQSTYQDLVEKIYVVLGVVMLFVLAYNVLMLIVDPDKNKSEHSIEKLLKNIVISFIMIVICPSVFAFAFNIQNAILNSNVIGKFFQDANSSGFDESSIKNGGKMMAYHSFIAFFNSDNKDSELKNRTSNTSYAYVDEEGAHIVDCSKGNCTLEEAKQVAQKDGTFKVFKAFAGNITEDEIEFDWLVALVVGIYLVYVIISFCFDMAVRVCKLAFYQIIAPIAIACRILPKKDSIFNNWLKATTSTYFAVFIRVIIMNLGVFLISVFIDSNFFASYCKGCSFGVQLIAYAFIILGIVTFIKQAPKLVDDVFGFGDIKLGIKEKFKEGTTLPKGMLTAGSALGAGTSSLVRNATHAFGKGGTVSKTFKDPNASGASKAASIFRGVGSTFGGGVAGTVRGLSAGSEATSYKDMAAAAGKGAKDTINKRDSREAYRAAHGLKDAQGRDIPFVGGIGSVGGHVKDTWGSVKDWAGVSSDMEGLQAEKAVYDEGIDFQKRLFDLVSDDERVLTYEGQKKKAQEKEIDSTKYSLGSDGKYAGIFGGKHNSVQEAMAADIKAKEQQVKMYDELIKIAKLRKVNSKLVEGKDQRFLAIQEEYKRYKERHSDISTIRDMPEISTLDSTMQAELEAAIDSLDPAKITAFLDKMKASGTGTPIMANTEAYKRESGRVANELGKRRDEQKKKEGK